LCFGREPRPRRRALNVDFPSGLPLTDVHLDMSNDAVVSIYQHSRGAIGANNTSTFTISLLNPDDCTDLGAIPGLAAGEWVRVGQDDAVDVAEAIGEILTQNRVLYRVEWP
jgi:hypothetical protein